MLKAQSSKLKSVHLQSPEGKLLLEHWRVPQHAGLPFKTGIRSSHHIRFNHLSLDFVTATWAALQICSAHQT